MNKAFEAVRIEELLALDGRAHLDALPFGVIGFAPDAILTVYNETEAKNAGLRPERVIATVFGHNFNAFHDLPGLETGHKTPSYFEG